MNERESPDFSDYPTLHEDELVASLVEKIRILVEALEITESPAMTKLLAEIEAATEEELFVQLCDQYMGLSSDLIDGKTGQQERLRAQVGGFLLDARMYLMVRMIPEYNEALENASLAAPNLEDRTIAREINKLFLD